MVDTLTLITQVSSTVTLVIIGIAMFMSFIALRKLRGGGKFEKSLKLHTAFLVLFSFAVAVMSLYHWMNSEFFEESWYALLNICLVVGILSSIFAIKFWKETAPEKKSSGKKRK